MPLHIIMISCWNSKKGIEGIADVVFLEVDMCIVEIAIAEDPAQTPS